MTGLKVQDYHGRQVIDSRDVAVMVEREHNALLKSIRQYADYLSEGEIALGDFFIESTYARCLTEGEIPPSESTPHKSALSLWWVLKDVCDILWLKKTVGTAKRLDGDEVDFTDIIDSNGKIQERYLNEGDFPSVESAAQRKIAPGDFFIESSYRNEKAVVA